MTKVFIDGSAGTTGLNIHKRLSKRTDIEIIELSEEHRKNTSARKLMLNDADIAFLCLPDAASIEAVQLIDNENTIIIDTSTAHRVNPAWTYGFPELTGFREKIKCSNRIANPGCHASGVISLIQPLVSNGIISNDIQISAFSITGYSGGGKKMIGQYESEDRPVEFEAPRMYGLNQEHKHLKEIKTICDLKIAPIFCPIVSSYYSGMEVVIPVFRDQIKGNAGVIKEIYKECYFSGMVHFVEQMDQDGFISANVLCGKDTMEVSVAGNEERILLVSRFDNLGKGACGAAIQNMNIVLGVEETTGLNL